MWSPLLAPGRLSLVHAGRATLRDFGQEAAHHLIHSHDGSVLWCDGDHGFNPYDFAEVNLTRGYEADWGADRLLVKRCMTPFQWDTVLTKQLDQKLVDTYTSAVFAIPFDRLFSTDELKDWEQEDYVAFAVNHLKRLARRHHVPILLGVDMAAWWKTHPVLAATTFDGVDDRWSLGREAGRWRAVRDRDRRILEPTRGRQVTLEDFVEEEHVVEAVVAGEPRPVAVADS